MRRPTIQLSLSAQQRLLMQSVCALILRIAASNWSNALEANMKANHKFESIAQRVQLRQSLLGLALLMLAAGLAGGRCFALSTDSEQPIEIESRLCRTR